MTRLRIRIELAGRHTVGPGKIQLLEAVESEGSISAAARSMRMSYRHAWEMLADMNQCFRDPVIATETGGRAGGGARVTRFGRELIERYRGMQEKAQGALQGELDALTAACATAPGAAAARERRAGATEESAHPPPRRGPGPKRRGRSPST